MERRIAERRRRSGRWLNADPAPRQATAPYQQAVPPSAQPQQPQDGQMQDPAGGRVLGAFARGGLQRKISRFAETVNSLRRAQQERGASLSWGRPDASVEAPAAAQPGSPQPQQAPAGWEQQLGVTRVRRRATAPSRGVVAGGPAAGEQSRLAQTPVRGPNAGGHRAPDNDEQLDW